MINNLIKLEKVVISATVFLVPVTVLSVFPNPFITPKVLLIFVGAALAILIRAVITLLSGNLQVTRSSFDVSVGLIALISLLSALLVSTSSTEAFFLPGTATVVVGSALFYYLLTIRGKDETSLVKLALFLSGVTAAALTLFAFSNITSKIAFLPTLLKVPSFTTLEGYLAAVIFFLVITPLAVEVLIKQKALGKKVAVAIGIAILLLGIMASVSGLVTISDTSSLNLLDTNTSWQVLIETIKDSPLLGAGSSNYLTSFTKFRPITFNNSDLWNLRFTSANNYYLTFATETGILGIIALVVLLLSVYKVTKSSLRAKGSKGKKILLSNLNLVSLLLLLLLLFFFPATNSIIFILFILLGLVALDHHPKDVTINLTASTLSSGSTKGKSRLPAMLITVPVIILMLFLIFMSFRVVSAEVSYRNALVAINENNADKAFEQMNKAITLNPKVDRYHSTTVQLYLAVARSLAQKEDLTDADRAAIAQAIQNAIAQAKAVVALNPERAVNWELLASTYVGVAPLAQGANDFAVQSYQQAIVLDPFNPNYRIALGRIYFALGDYESAIDVFKLAVAAKPDHANSHFNLASAYKENEQVDRAIEEMTIVLALVDPESEDYTLAKIELEKLETEKGSIVRAQVEEIELGTEELSPPQPQEAELDPTLDLPEDAEPPIGVEEDVLDEEAGPSPTPSPTPTVKP